MKKVLLIALVMSVSCENPPFQEKYCWQCAEKLTKNFSRASSGPDVLLDRVTDHCNLSYSEIQEVKEKLYREAPQLQPDDTYTVHCWIK